MHMRIEEIKLDGSIDAVKMENEYLEIIVLPFKGADIYSLVYKPLGIDLLLKTPWGLNRADQGAETSFNSEVVWMANYPGGWQILFPNGGDACTYKGVELNFHGEASMVSWNYNTVKTETGPALALHTKLFKSPFTIERILQCSPDSPTFTIKETITNNSPESMEYMYGHHPAFGGDFIGESCIISTDAGTITVDDVYEGENNPLKLGSKSTWPLAETKNGGDLDLSRIPGKGTPRDVLCYLSDFTDGRFSIINKSLNVGVEMKWPAAVFPHAWFWQEFSSSSGYPFYKQVYTMAIEPNSSIPGQGLVNVIDKTGYQKILGPFEKIDTEIDFLIFIPVVS